MLIRTSSRPQPLIKRSLSNINRFATPYCSCEWALMDDIIHRRWKDRCTSVQDWIQLLHYTHISRYFLLLPPLVKLEPYLVQYSLPMELPYPYSECSLGYVFRNFVNPVILTQLEMPRLNVLVINFWRKFLEGWKNSQK